VQLSPGTRASTTRLPVRGLEGGEAAPHHHTMQLKEGEASAALAKPSTKDGAPSPARAETRTAAPTAAGGGHGQHDCWDKNGTPAKGGGKGGGKGSSSKDSGKDVPWKAKKDKKKKGKGAYPL
jgi:hypothetical protein